MQTNSRFQRTIISTLVFSLLLTICVAMPTRAQEKSLYQRLGGYDALAAVVDDFIVRLVTDKQFERFSSGTPTTRRSRFASTFSISSVRRLVAHAFTGDAT